MESKRLSVTLPSDLVDAVEDYRRKQEVIPSQNEALVALIKLGLKEEARKK